MKAIYIAFTILLLANAVLFIYLYISWKEAEEVKNDIYKRDIVEVDEPDEFINFS